MIFFCFVFSFFFLCLGCRLIEIHHTYVGNVGICMYMHTCTTRIITLMVPEINHKVEYAFFLFRISVDM